LVSKKSVLSVSIGAVIGAALLAPAAHAADQVGAAPAGSAVTVAACPVAETPYKSGHFAVGEGHAYGCGNGPIQLILQRHRAWGWSNVAQGSFRSPGEKAVYFDCQGEGTYTYRTVLAWRSADGRPHTDISDEARFSC
jgi:hypothetical protein